MMKSICLILLYIFLSDCSTCRAFNQGKKMPVQKAVEDFGVYPDVIKTIPKSIVEASTR